MEAQVVCTGLPACQCTGRRVLDQGGLTLRLGSGREIRRAMPVGGRKGGIWAEWSAVGNTGGQSA